MKQRFVFIALAALSLASMMAVGWNNFGFHRSRQVGDKVDSLHSVYVYYNGSVANVTGRNTAPDGYNLGLKYQCVEFVKRYYYQHLKHRMPDSYGHAKDFFDSKIADGGYSKRRDLKQYSNPSVSKPAVSDLIVYKGTLYNEYGHVSIVSQVFENEIEIIQQNPGPMSPSRERIPLIKTVDGKYRIDHSLILGWLRK